MVQHHYRRPPSRERPGESLFRFERRRDRLLGRRRFYRRMAAFGSIGFGMMLVSLMIGMFGYHFIVRLSWIDAFVNASMILGGMGPLVTDFPTAGAKLFAGFYALFSGLVILASASVILSPLFHRLLHRFHADVPDSGT